MFSYLMKLASILIFGYFLTACSNTNKAIKKEPEAQSQLKTSQLVVRPVSPSKTTSTVHIPEIQHNPKIQPPVKKIVKQVVKPKVQKIQRKPQPKSRNVRRYDLTSQTKNSSFNQSR